MQSKPRPSISKYKSKLDETGGKFESGLAESCMSKRLRIVLIASSVTAISTQRPDRIGLHSHLLFALPSLTVLLLLLLAKSAKDMQEPPLREPSEFPRNSHLASSSYPASAKARSKSIRPNFNMDSLSSCNSASFSSSSHSSQSSICEGGIQYSRFDDIKSDVKHLPFHENLRRPNHVNTMSKFKPQFNKNRHHQRAFYNIANNNAWKEYPELDIRVTGFDNDTTLQKIYSKFKDEQNLVKIDFPPPSANHNNRVAYLTFRPPPSYAFWFVRGSYDGLKFTVLPLSRSFTVTDPLNNSVQLPESMVQRAEKLEFGFMVNDQCMMSMLVCHATLNKSIDFELDLLRRHISIRFHLSVTQDHGLQTEKVVKLGYYQLHVQFEQLSTIFVENQGHFEVFTIPVDNPPRFFRQTNNVEETLTGKRVWKEWDTWERQTDVVLEKDFLRGQPVGIQKNIENTVLDIGRWSTYRVVFKASSEPNSMLNRIRLAIAHFNIKVVETKAQTILRKESDLWDLINTPDILDSKNSKTGYSSLLSEIMTRDFFQLSFETHYQLEVCISQGVLHETNISQDFLDKLSGLDRNDKAAALGYLEKAALLGKRIFDPMDIFKLPLVFKEVKGIKRPPRHCTITRSAVITPTMVYFSTPVVEISNRVIRDKWGVSDRFLRVRFTHEKGSGSGQLLSDDSNHNKEVFERINQVLKNGIVLGDRKYEFLAFGNSQFREHGAFFFAPNAEETCDSIRAGLGRWLRKDERIPSKVCARLGQNFSTTRGLSIKVVVKTEHDNGTLILPDIERNGYCFSDGVGKISPFLAKMVAEELGLPTEDAPSVLQFRLGGCKGVLAIDPALPNHEIHLRKSQYKFAAMHEGLEVIRTSSYISASLNRQIIVVLSTLGVPDSVFMGKLDEQLDALEKAMADEHVAKTELEKAVDYNQTSLTMAAMVQNGFMRSQEPFMMSMLQLWRSWMLKYLKEKAKINLEKGACLFGCVDETATLRGHFNTSQPKPGDTLEEKLSKLPQIFCFIDKNRRGIYEPIEGLCILARNPSLHPGDIRVVCAIDVPHLHHLKNVVVLPQTGDRDIGNMCSGGDLDGDDYLICWDLDMIPREWNYPAMDFIPPKGRPLKHVASVNDLTDFFVEYMKSNKLPMIAHRHLALADYCERGVKDERCIQLAHLHSHAVDYPKSGVPVKIPSTLMRVKWPHFMEKSGHSYISKKILGQLYDRVVRVDFHPDYTSPFDRRILAAYEHEDETLKTVETLKEQYDSQIRSIMAQHGIATEFEVWSGFVMKHNGEKRDYTFAQELGDLVEATRKSLREECIRVAKAGTSSNVNSAKLQPFVAAMYVVTARQIQKAIEEDRSEIRGDIDQQKVPLMSFPWLFTQELGKIARGGAHMQESMHLIQSTQKKHHDKAAPVVNAKRDEEIQTDGIVVPRGQIFGAFGDGEESIKQVIQPSAPLSNGMHADVPDGDMSGQVEVFIDFGKGKPLGVDGFGTLPKS